MHRSLHSRFAAIAFAVVLLAPWPFMAGGTFPDRVLAADAELGAGKAHVADRHATGFEENEPGPFDTLKTSLGVWTQTAGTAIVDDQHAKSGKKSLHLTGGDKTRVTLKLAPDIDTSGELSFWAERWTQREPFSFRVEKNSGNGWQEVFHDQGQVRVGRSFLSRITIPLNDRDIKQLRFTVESPPNTGVLIDDVRVAPARRQRIVSITAIPLTLPALVGVSASPLVKLKVETEGSLMPLALTQVRASLFSQQADIETAQVYFSGASDQFSTEKAFGKPFDVLAAIDSPLTVSGEQPLAEGENYVWIACKLSPHANIDHTVGATGLTVSFSNGQSESVGATTTQRIGVALRKAGDDGVNTFRIPGLATTNRGTLIGVYDVRRRSGGDLPGDIDVGMSRSTDGGRTWEPMRIIMDMGDDPAWRYDGIGDPAVLVDRVKGTVWVAATWSHGDRSWRGSGQGLTPEETGQVMLVRSDDDGGSWSEPINITQQVKKPEWCFVLMGPGKGITMRDGTLVFAAQYQDPPNQADKTAHRLPHSTIIYSVDNGQSWSVGTGAFDDTTEAQVVEVQPGELMLNCRYNRAPVRVVMTTRDMGKTWQQHSTSQRSLIEPGSCMASLIDTTGGYRGPAVDRTTDSKVARSRSDDRRDNGWLLFSNPDSTDVRRRMTIKASPDRGESWPEEQRLLLDEAKSAGYSCMTMIDDKTVGILYEGSQAHMTFQRIALSELIGGADEADEADEGS